MKLFCIWSLCGVLVIGLGAMTERSARASEIPGTEQFLRPIFKSNKDINLSLGAVVQRTKVRQTYHSKIGLNFNEQGSVIVNDVEIRMIPVRQGDAAAIQLDVFNAETGKLLRDSIVKLSDLRNARTEIVRPDSDILKVAIRMEKLN